MVIEVIIDNVIKGKNLKNFELLTSIAFWGIPLILSDRNGWSDAGCYVNSTNGTHIICICNHLTDFAVASTSPLKGETQSSGVSKNPTDVMEKTDHLSQVNPIPTIITLSHRKLRHDLTTSPKLNVCYDKYIIYSSCVAFFLIKYSINYSFVSRILCNQCIFSCLFETVFY